MLNLLLLISAYILGVSGAKSVNPTVNNSTGEYYIVRQTSNPLATSFKNSLISCTSELSTNCVVLCKGRDRCTNTKIDASKADTLILQCSGDKSCNGLQITAGPQTTASISCSGSIACSNAYFAVDDSEVVSLSCYRSDATLNQQDERAGSPCISTTLSATASDTVAVHCNSFNCWNSVFLVNNSARASFTMAKDAALSVYIDASGVTERAQLICEDDFSCVSSNIICPTTAGDCVVECYEGINTCSELNVHIPDHTYSNLELECVGSNTCSDVKFSCDEDSTWSYLFWIESEAQYDCLDDSCCPRLYPADETYECEAGKACEIDCSNMEGNSTCFNTAFVGISASSLKIICHAGDYSCASSRIECPMGENAQCEVECHGQRSCESTVVALPTSNNVKIVCDHELACKDQHIEALTYSKYNINRTDNRIETLDMHCTAQDSCNHVTVGFGMEFGKMNVHCKEYQSCYGMALMSAYALSLYCTAELACFETVVYLTVENDATSHIVCDTNSNDGVPSMGSCYKAMFGAYSNNETDSKGGDVNVVCNSGYACEEARIATDELRPFDELNVQCTAKHSCRNSMITAPQLPFFGLECDGMAACYNSTILCPVDDADACKIGCKAGEEVCRLMTIISQAQYANDSIALECAAPDLFPGACDDLTITCEDADDESIESKEDTTVYYDEKNSEYIACVEDNVVNATWTDTEYKLCCPLDVTTKRPEPTTTKKRTTAKPGTTKNGGGGDNGKNDEKKASNTGMILGIVGGILGLALIAGIVWFVVSNRRRKEGLLLMQNDGMGVQAVGTTRPYEPPTN